MENNDLLQPQLQVDGTTAAHLLETAKWAKFLAIVGFVGCALLVAAGLFMGSIMGVLASHGGGRDFGHGVMFTGMTLGYILIAFLYFFPCLQLYRFATKMKIALQSNDQPTLNDAFSNHRRLYKFMGILMIIGLVFYALIIVGLFFINMFKR